MATKAKGFKTRPSEKTQRSGEQGMRKPSGFSGGAKRKPTGFNEAKRAYIRRQSW